MAKRTSQRKSYFVQLITRQSQSDPEIDLALASHQGEKETSVRVGERGQAGAKNEQRLVF